MSVIIDHARHISSRMLLERHRHAPRVADAPGADARPSAMPADVSLTFMLIR